MLQGAAASATDDHSFGEHAGSIKGQDFSLQELVQHVAKHSTYHRGQVVLLLRQTGQVPPATDFGFFLIETRSTLPNER
jgi:uncharacterized damage-inducible protein DinB